MGRWARLGDYTYLHPTRRRWRRQGCACPPPSPWQHPLYPASHSPSLYKYLQLICNSIHIHVCILHVYVFVLYLHCRLSTVHPWGWLAVLVLWPQITYYGVKWQQENMSRFILIFTASFQDWSNRIYIIVNQNVNKTPIVETWLHFVWSLQSLQDGNTFKQCTCHIFLAASLLEINKGLS